MNSQEFCKLRAKQLHEKSLAPNWVSRAAERTFERLAEEQITSESIDQELKQHEGQPFGRKEVDLLGAIAAKIDLRSFLKEGKAFFEATNPLDFEKEVNKRLLRSEVVEITPEEYAKLPRNKWRDGSIKLHGEN